MALRRRSRPRAVPDVAHFAYSRWDGTQAGFDLDADHILTELADDLLYHGDLSSALRRLMAEGLHDASGRSMAGLREMLERLRERRRELLDRHDLGGVYDDIAEALREVVRIEREALAEAAGRAETPRAEGDERRAELAARAAAAKSVQLDMMPPDLAGQFKALDAYDFESDEARRRFQGLAELAELSDIDGLENLLRGSSSPGALAEADLEAARHLLGNDAAESLRHMAGAARMLEEAGLIENREGRLQMTPRAIRKLGQAALRDLFAKLSVDRPGRHSTLRSGPGHERSDDTKPYSYGDPFNLHITRTLSNALTRSGGGVPVKLHPDDFEVERTEQQVRSATVLMLDLSLSMPMRNNFLPAKKVAMALHALISSQYPRDFLGLVSFSEVAREFRPERLPEVSWDYVYGTNMQHGLMLARRMLNRQSGNKQIIMITDGEPTAHITPSGRPFFCYPPARETVELTLSEAARCTRDGIRINTFMLDATPYLTDFVERITKLNGGRAFFTTSSSLGDYVLVDFVEHKRSLVRSRR